LAVIPIVEDDELNLKLVTIILTRAGHRVVGAGSAELGLLLAYSEAPSLIIMDVKLPEMTGLEATRRLKTDPSVSGIPVRMLTAYAMQEDRAKAFACGCQDFITKPIDMKAFVTAVRSLTVPSIREHQNHRFDVFDGSVRAGDREHQPHRPIL
jgi:two-component system cell cycle response regulator DivK